jgi:hypothetical protein
LPATNIGLLDFCPDFIGMESAHRFAPKRETKPTFPRRTAELVSHLREIDTVSLETVDHASPDVLTRCHQTFGRCAVNCAWQRCWTSNNHTIRKSRAGTRA